MLSQVLRSQSLELTRAPVYWLYVANLRIIKASTGRSQPLCSRTVPCNIFTAERCPRVNVTDRRGNHRLLVVPTLRQGTTTTNIPDVYCFRQRRWRAPTMREVCCPRVLIQRYTVRYRSETRQNTMPSGQRSFQHPKKCSSRPSSHRILDRIGSRRRPSDGEAPTIRPSVHRQVLVIRGINIIIEKVPLVLGCHRLRRNSYANAPNSYA